MRRAGLAGLAVAAWLALVPAAALAQWPSRDPFRPGAIELDVLGSWQGAAPVGSSRAVLSGNQGAPQVPFFDTTTEIEASAGVEARLGVHVTRAFALEGAFRYARPRLATRISADFEDAPDITATERFSQYVIELDGVFHLRGRRPRSIVPFLAVGAGYLRELHDGREMVETGQLAHAGGGLKVLFSQSPRGLVRAIGIRLDARVYLRRGGVELDDDEPLRTYGAAAAGLLVGF